MIHSSFVKEKQHSIPLLCYIIIVIKRLTISWSSRSSVRKNIPYKILAIGNCSAEIFGCSIEVLIPSEIMTSSEVIFGFQEIIEVLIWRSTLNFLVNLHSKGSYFPGKLDSRVLISRIRFYRDTRIVGDHFQENFPQLRRSYVYI